MSSPTRDFDTGNQEDLPMAVPPAAGRTAPDLITPLPGPKAAALVARDKQVMSPSYTRPYPLAVARGYGSTIEDVDGNLFLDFTAGIAVTATGHCHPEVAAAIADQASRLIHMSGTDFYYQPEIELAERLAELGPMAAPKRVFFTNSGAESIEAALKLSRYHTRRQHVISFIGAFHGRTYGAMSLGASKSIQRRGFGPEVPGVHRLPYNCQRDDVDNLFKRVVAPDEVAAIFVEPVQGEGGYIVPRGDFLPMLREVCDEHGILLVCDEIQSGMGRTGRWFACQHFDVQPDIVCLAKGIASGMPLGAIVTGQNVMDWPPGSHASTFGGNPVSCRAALATLDLLEREYVENSRQRGEQITAALNKLTGKYPILSGVRGLGLMQAVDLPTPAQRDAVVQEAFHSGLLLLGCGASAIRFCPSLCVSEKEVHAAISICTDVFAGITS